jgi:hypothetical protein
LLQNQFAMPKHTNILDAILSVVRAYASLGRTNEERADKLLESISAMPFDEQERAYAALDRLQDILAEVRQAIGQGDIATF